MRSSGLQKKHNKGYLAGTFDLFHVGHLAYLENAKSFCDYLVVGVNNDIVVQGYKGRLPLITCADRIRIISAIKYVDEVIEISDRDKVNDFINVHFNVLFMSLDWKNDPFYLNIEEEMRQLGVNVIWLPYSKGVSTSQIINKAISVYNS